MRETSSNFTQNNTNPTKPYRDTRVRLRFTFPFSFPFFRESGVSGDVDVASLFSCARILAGKLINVREEQRGFKFSIQSSEAPRCLIAFARGNGHCRDVCAVLNQRVARSKDAHSAPIMNRRGIRASVNAAQPRSNV